MHLIPLCYIVEPHLHTHTPAKQQSILHLYRQRAAWQRAQERGYLNSVAIGRSYNPLKRKRQQTNCDYVFTFTCCCPASHHIIPNVRFDRPPDRIWNGKVLWLRTSDGEINTYYGEDERSKLLGFFRFSLNVIRTKNDVRMFHMFDFRNKIFTTAIVHHSLTLSCWRYLKRSKSNVSKPRQTKVVRLTRKRKRVSEQGTGAKRH